MTRHSRPSAGYGRTHTNRRKWVNQMADEKADKQAKAANAVNKAAQKTKETIRNNAAKQGKKS